MYKFVLVSRLKLPRRTPQEAGGRRTRFFFGVVVVVVLAVITTIIFVFVNFQNDVAPVEGASGAETFWSLSVPSSRTRSY